MKAITTASILAGIAGALVLCVPAWSQDESADPQAAEAEPETAAEPGDTPAADGAAKEPAAEAGDTPAAEDGATDAEPGETEGGPVVVTEEEEGSVLDDQTFEGDDDDFIPTEEIPVDEPIPFPTDI